MAFSVEDIEELVAYLSQHQVTVEDNRVDPFTNKRFTFFADRMGGVLRYMRSNFV